jgi:hypothetical protein
MLRQETDQADEPEQADQVPDQIVLAPLFGEPVLRLGGKASALPGLCRGWADCGGHEEQREYQSPRHSHPPSLI